MNGCLSELKVGCMEIMLENVIKFCPAHVYVYESFTYALHLCSMCRSYKTISESAIRIAIF